jgi:hypothetical protein
MGGRGSSNKGALGATRLALPSGVNTSQEDLAKILGFNNKAQLHDAQELKKFIGPGTSDEAKVADYVAHHGMGSIGPIMLRIGLPRNKLLDIFHALKPLHDHGILTATMPISYKHYEDPFDLAAHASANDNGAMAALARTVFNIPSGASYLKRLENLPLGLLGGDSNGRKKK